ncbi:MAG: GDSL-type esterase/lipase family protein [bacterium]
MHVSAYNKPYIHLAAENKSSADKSAPPLTTKKAHHKKHTSWCQKQHASSQHKQHSFSNHNKHTSHNATKTNIAANTNPFTEINNVASVPVNKPSDLTNPFAQATNNMPTGNINKANLDPNAPTLVYGDSTSEQLGKKLGGPNLGIVGAGFYAKKLAPVSQIPANTKQILISMGYNDYDDATKSPEQYINRTKNLINEMKAQAPGVKIAVLSIKGTTKSKDENDKIAKMNEILKNIASKEGLQFVDLGDTGNIKCSDGIHFKDNNKYAEAVKQALNKQFNG